MWWTERHRASQPVVRTPCNPQLPTEDGPLRGTDEGTPCGPLIQGRFSDDGSQHTCFQGMLIN